MSDVQDFNLLLLLHNAIDHMIDVRFVPVEQVSQLAFGANHWTAVGVLFQAENALLETPIPCPSRTGIPGVDFLIQIGQVALGANCDVNEISHALLRIRRRTLSPTGPFLPLRSPALGEYPR